MSIDKFNRKPSHAPQNVPLNPYGAFHRDLCSHFLNLQAVLDGLRVAGSGNSRRDFEPIWGYGHFELPVEPALTVPLPRANCPCDTSRIRKLEAYATLAHSVCRRAAKPRPESALPIGKFSRFTTLQRLNEIPDSPLKRAKWRT